MEWGREITDPGDGYGFLLNGNNLGYIQAVYAQADYAVNSTDSSQDMRVYGEDLKTCAENLAVWAPILQQNILTILTSTSATQVDGSISEVVKLANQMLNGVDLNENGEIEAIAGEGGVKTAYQRAYSMADMPVLPVSGPSTQTALSPTFTSTPSPIQTVVLPTRTSIRQPNSPAHPTNTSSPNNGNPNPTKKPTKTKNPNHP